MHKDGSFFLSIVYVVGIGWTTPTISLASA
jgi:hypothetical protein